jgi:hypothetical protein
MQGCHCAARHVVQYLLDDDALLNHKTKLLKKLGLIQRSKYPQTVTSNITLRMRRNVVSVEQSDFQNQLLLFGTILHDILLSVLQR